MRSESLGATGELHSSPDMKKAGSLYKAVILLSIAHALLGDPCCAVIVFWCSFAVIVIVCKPFRCNGLF